MAVLIQIAPFFLKRGLLILKSSPLKQESLTQNSSTLLNKKPCLFQLFEGDTIS